jgi:uncharacterized protein (TIGR00255 family)
MPVMSMTGFARVDGRHADWRWQFEGRSVNGKSLDVRLRLPPGLDALEAPIRERISRKLKRGNIQVTLELVRETPTAVARINEPLLRDLAAAARRLSADLGVAAPTLDALLQVKGVVDVAESTADEAAIAERNAGVLDSADALAAELARARAAEGARIEGVLVTAVARIAQLTDAARAAPGRSPEAVKQRIAEQVARLRDEAGLDPDRLHQEALLIAVRADVQEEIDRLDAHIENARDLLASAEPVGRKLDFLAQEFNREANTLASKAADRELSRIGLDLKAVIDQFREQVQNVE